MKVHSPHRILRDATRISAGPKTSRYMSSRPKATTLSKRSNSLETFRKTGTKTSSFQSSRRSRLFDLYVAAIGGSGAARVVASNIFPMKVQQPEKIVDLLEKLKVVLNGVPPPWLRKILSKNQERTFEFEEETANG